MYRPVTEAICGLERLGLKVLILGLQLAIVIIIQIIILQVLAITGDGASSNRLLFKLLSPDDVNMPYKVKNPFTEEDRNIYFISDPPHLLKTIRNCIFNKKRDLWVCVCIIKCFLCTITCNCYQNNGKTISWDHNYCETVLYGQWQQHIRFMSAWSQSSSMSI